MPQVLSISSQPSADAIVSVYRPILFTVNVSDTQPPQVVYCDVYVNDVFYRTLTKTIYKKLNVGSSDWEFDVQDPCQEVLGKHLPVYGGDDLILARQCSAVIKCKFRGSTIDANGFLIPEATAPVQGTATTDPVAGTGVESNSFFALNVALQHEHNQVLSSHLSAYKNGTWSSSAFPMSHRANNYTMGATNNDYYAMFYKGANALAKIKLYYRNRGVGSYSNSTVTVSVVNEESTALAGDPNGYYYMITDNGDGTQTVTFYYPIPANCDSIKLRYNDGTNHDTDGAAVSPRSITMPTGSYAYSIIFHFVGGSSSIIGALDGLAETSDPVDSVKGVYFIPDGPKNLTSLFPAIVWRNVQDYYVQVLDSADAVVATSVVNRMQDWFNDDEHERVYFLNDCGCIDALNFLKPNATTEDSSSKFQTSVGSPLLKSDFSGNRFNVRGNETREVIRNSEESETSWLEECKRSVMAFRDWTGIESQSDGYMSIVILNGKMDKIKRVDDYIYKFILQFELSNDRPSIRN